MFVVSAVGMVAIVAAGAPVEGRAARRQLKKSKGAVFAPRA
jgi:hypothetical protein